MTDVIVLEGNNTIIVTTEVIEEIVTEGVQGPAGPPGPSNTSSAGNGIILGAGNTISIDEAIVATKEYVESEINDLALVFSQTITDGDARTLNSANTYTDTKSNEALDSAKAYTDAAVTQIIRDCGDYTLVGILFPTTGGSGVGGAIRKGDMFWIKGATIGSNLQGVPVNNSDQIRALANAPAQNPFLWGVIEGNLGFTPENKDNKATDLSSPDNVKYPTTMLLYNQLLLKANTSSLSTVAQTGDYGDLLNRPVIPGPQTFFQKRWYQSDITSTSAVEGFSAANIGTGTVTYTANIAGMYGTAKFTSSTAANTGARVAAINPIYVSSGGVLVLAVFILESSVATRVIRIGLCGSFAYVANEAAGAFVEISNVTAVACSVTGTSNITTAGSNELPLNTILACAVKFLTQTSVRFVVFNLATGFKYLNQTINTNTPLTSEALYSVMKGWSTGTAIVDLCVADYIGGGMSEPNEVALPD